MNFEIFLKWLNINCMDARTIITLGGRSSFKAIIGIDGRSLTIECGSKGRSGFLSENDLFAIWERYFYLPDDRKGRTGEYTDPKWPERQNRYFAPYLPALI